MSLETGSFQRVNFGPYHPSIKGMLRLMLELDGELIQKSTCYVGFTHKGFEKTLENKPLFQAQKMIEKIDQDFLTPHSLSYAFVLGIEKILNVQPSIRGQFIRVMLAEIGRIFCHLNHIVTITENMDFNFVALWCLSLEKKINDLFVELRKKHKIFLIPGGVTVDLPSPFLKEVYSLVGEVRKKVSNIQSVLLNNVVFKLRTIQVGVVSEVDALSWGLSGPSLRASRVAWDLRRAQPYDVYDQIDFRIPVGTYGDSFERTAIRLEEIIQSVSIVEQCLDLLPAGEVNNLDSRLSFSFKGKTQVSTEARISHYKAFSEGIHLPASHTWVSIEGARGESGIFLSSNGSNLFDRIRLRMPGFFNLQAVESLMKGYSFSDLPTLLASFDIYSAEVDR